MFVDTEFLKSAKEESKKAENSTVTNSEMALGRFLISLSQTVKTLLSQFLRQD